MCQICAIISRKYKFLKDYKNELKYLKKSHNYMFERKWLSKPENSLSTEILLPNNIKNSLQDFMISS